MVGHTFGPHDLAEATEPATEAALWAAILLFEQHKHISQRMASRETRGGRMWTADLYRRRADESEEQALILRRLLRLPTP